MNKDAADPVMDMNDDIYEKAAYAQSLIDGARIATSDLLNDAIDYFEPMQVTYDEYSLIREEKIPGLDQRFSGFLIGGIISLALGILTQLAVSALSRIDFLSDIMKRVPISTVHNICLVLIILGILLIAAKIIIEVIRLILLRRYDMQMEELEERLDIFYRKSEFVNVIGLEYTDPNILRTLLSYVLSGRANILSESINCYLFDKATNDSDE